MKRFALLTPFLFALFPILSLFSSNLGQLRTEELVMPLAIALGATVLLVLVAAATMRDAEAAAIAVSFLWLLLAIGAHLLPPVYRAQPLLAGGLLVIWAALFLGAAVALWRRRGHLHDLATIGAVIGVALVAMPLATIVPRLVARQRLAQVQRFAFAGPTVTDLPPTEEPGPADVASAAPVQALEAAAPSPAATPSETPTSPPTSAPPTATPVVNPDIYYIILDGYARADVLQELYGVDNSPFLSWLAEKGFYVADQSQANYCQTYLSLASSLNSTYLDDLAQRMGASDDRVPLGDMIRHSAVVDFLHQQGYTYVAFSTGYADQELKLADVYKVGPWSPSALENEIISTTPISPVIAMQYELHRQRLFYAFDNLPEVTAEKGPLFVLAHIMAPHPPFVFGPDGERIAPNRPFMISDGSDYMSRGSKEEYVEGYAGQLRYINGRVQTMVEAILERSTRPAVIILQADHGPGSMLNWSSAEKSNLHERLSILNAYYLPGAGRELLYGSITPVNTFRVLFNAYFGAHNELLPDESYYSPFDHPYQFVPMPK